MLPEGFVGLYYELWWLLSSCWLLILTAMVSTCLVYTC